MLPGKIYTPEDILKMLFRRFWVLAVPCAIVGAATAMVARQLPDRYRSEAVILVVPQQVPQQYVRSTITTRIEDRLQAIAQQILSRTRLERIIEEFNLYPEYRSQETMEDLVARMRLDIRPAPVKGDAFRVSFVGSNPKTVQLVTSRVASLFIEESLRDRSVLAEGTTQFLEVQLDEARRRLVEQEKKLENYRTRYAGELPQQISGNLQALSNTQMQIQATLESMNRDRDSHLLLQRQLAAAESDDVEDDDVLAAGPTTPNGSDPVAAGSTAKQLSAARATLAQLELRYKPDYPDIPRYKRLIRDLEQKLDAEALSRPVSTATNPAMAGLSTKEQLRLKRIDDLKAQIDALDKRVVGAQVTEARLRERATELQAKIDSVPARESEMVELTRDYGTLQDTYTSLLRKKEDSNISANLERRQIGEQFKLLDPAQVPERPFSPNRAVYTLSGLGAGLGIGLLIVMLIEYRDSSFSNDIEITKLLDLPVLAVVPVMKSEAERRREVFRRSVTGLGLGSTVLGCLAIVAYTLVR